LKKEEDQVSLVISRSEDLCKKIKRLQETQILKLKTVEVVINEYNNLACTFPEGEELKEMLQ
jgi:hypothetical protein